MDWLLDATFLSRLQFALTAVFHYFFVPLSIGLGLILAINETRYYCSRTPEHAAATKFWVRIFTATFAVGVATGITMEFSFGTNWADYARFVGDIFGAPLAAEALFAFFLESVFLGVLLFGRTKVSPRFYLVAAWLVFFGSCLSALWILIANSWMQTPAGAVLAADGSKAVITDFLAAAFNPSTVPRYGHTVFAVLTMGSFVAMGVAAWYLLKGRHKDFALRTLRIGAVAGIACTAVLLVFAHSSAVVVAEEQPTKLAMMEGMYETEEAPLYLFGWVDEEAQEVISPFAIEGGTSFLATGSFDAEFAGLNDLAQTEQYGAIADADLPVNFVFQSYHLMVVMFGLIVVAVVMALFFSRGGRIANMKWVQRFLVISPIFPFIAIQSGWMVTEMGRQPWVVYPSVSGPEGVSLLTESGVSQSVSSVELLITLALFAVVYVLIFVAWVRVVSGFIKRGPVEEAVVSEVAADLGFMPGDAPASSERAFGLGEAAAAAAGGVTLASANPTSPTSDSAKGGE